MKQAKLLLCLLPCLLCACTPGLRTMAPTQQPAQVSNAAVQVFELHEAAPKQARVLDTLTISSSAFAANCSWDAILGYARTEAVKAGCSGLKILKHELPAQTGNCHQVVFTLLKLPVYNEQTGEMIAPAAPGKGIGPAFDIPYPPLRFGLTGGWSARTGAISDEVPAEHHEYVKGLMRGFNLGLDGTYFLNKAFGVGLKYKLYSATNSKSEYRFNSWGGSYRIDYKDQIAINFIGPTLNLRNFNTSDNSSVNLGLALGYLSYRNNGSINKTQVHYTGGTAGLGMSVGYDFGLNRNQAFGLQLTYTLGALAEYNVTDGQSTQRVKLNQGQLEDLSCVDLSAVIRFNK